MNEREHLRQILRTRRQSIGPAERMSAANQLADRLLNLPFARTVGAVVGYWASDGEIPLHAWQVRLPTTVRYCLPVLAQRTLRFAVWKPGDPIAPNRFGIPEPVVPLSQTLPAEAIDLVVLPLVGFHPTGYRLGMGGGWYDQTFSFRLGKESQPPPWLVGVGFALQRVSAPIPMPWDISLDAICTETTTYYCQ